MNTLRNNTHYDTNTIRYDYLMIRTLHDMKPHAVSTLRNKHLHNGSTSICLCDINVYLFRMNNNILLFNNIDMYTISA